MGELLRLLPAAVSLHEEPVIVDSKRSTSPAPSHKTVTVPPVSSTHDVKPQPGRGNATFSTDLGRHAPRVLQDPRYVQPIARSNMVLDVVTGAGTLLRKYPYQYLNIFPQQGWQIGDLWDDHDIQIEGDLFFKELLGFIGRDNTVRAQKYAFEWAYKYPERQTLIGGDTAAIYDKSDPLSIVDKLFVNGESRDYPPVFLWKVAHFLRTSMLVVKGITVPPKETVSAPERPVMGHKNSVVHSTVQAPASVEGTANGPVAMSTAAKASTPAVKSMTSTPNTQTVPTWHQEQRSPRIPAGALAHGRFAQPVGLVGGFGHAEPMGHMMPVLPAHQTDGPNSTQADLRYCRTRPGRSVSGSQNHIMPASPYVENIPRVPSGLGPRQHAGPMSMAQSPRFNQAHMTMNHPMGNVLPGMVPFTYDQGPVGPGMMAGQPHLADVMHPGSMPPHAMHGPPMAHGYPRQPSNAQSPPFTMPMGDMTNMHYGGPAGVAMQNMDSRRHGDRRISQQHVNGSVLYDPYEGSNPAFRTAQYSGGKKYNQSGLHNNNNGRQRKASFPGSRPYHGQYTNGRSQTGGPHIPGPKPYSEDNRAITQDREYGCYIDWIGPQNETVNELFVKDLPEDVQDAELEVLFQERLGVKPTSVNIRFSPQFPQQAQGRRHAFVGFPTAAIAKQALVVHSPTIRGLPVSITVPKRFFQKTLDVSPRDMIEAGLSAYSRYASNPNNREGRNRVSSIHEGSDFTASTTATKDQLSYSPQDARSDLHKKKKGKQIQQPQATAGSPDARKAKPKKRQESPTKEKPTAPTETVKVDAQDVSAKADGDVSASVAVQETTPTVSAQTEQPQTSTATPSTVAKEDVAKPVDAQAVALDPGAGGHAPKAAPNAPPQAVPQRVDPMPQQTVEPRTESVVEKNSVKPPVDVENTAAKPAPLILTDSEEPASDDDLKNDASFHSAAESQSDLEVKVDPNVGSDIANHGITIPAPEASTATTISAPAPSASASENTQKDMIVPSEDAVVPTTAQNEPPKPESKSTPMPPADSKAAVVPAATQQETKAPSTVTLVAGLTKKSGPQQTERISPFLSKKDREQLAKKEREQKKKAQKKEKELAQKAKAERAAASKATAKRAPAEDATTVKANSAVDETDVHDRAKFAADVESAGPRGGPAATTQDAEKAYAPAKKPASSATSHKAANDSRDKLGKRKGKTADTPTTKDTALAEVKSEDHGKQTNGTSIPNETGSVTNKDAKVEPQEIAQEKPQEISQEDALVPDAQSSKQDDTKKASSGAPESNTAVPPDEASTPSAKKKNKKKKKNPTVTEGEKEASKITLTCPDLEFRPKSPNPAWMGPIDMETDVQNYEEIMDKACGGPDDSDFSWSDLPTMEDGLVSDEGEAPANQAGGSRQHVSMNLDEVEQRKTFGHALFPKIKKLQPNMAIEIMARIFRLETLSEMAKLVADDSALVAKVDETVLSFQRQGVAGKKDVQPLTNQSSTVAQEEIVNRGIAALETRIAAKKEEMRAADANLAVYDKQLAERTDTQEASSADDGRIAALEAQLAKHPYDPLADYSLTIVAATKVETEAAEVNIAALDKQRAERVADQEPSDTVPPDSQPAKKKKANKHKNKKKKKAAENGEASQSGDTAVTTGGTGSAPSKAAAGPIDAEDPFANQLKEVDAIIKQGQNGAADSQSSAQLCGGAATPTDEPTLMRTMEAYFREAHPERRSKGSKVLKEDLQ